MKKEGENKKNEIQGAPLTPDSQVCLYAQTPKGITIGVASASEPSSLALLATGVTGIAARRARLERAKKCSV
ncbi:MAG: PEP-CTERM sorting domain-containing protein [Gloeomargaritales cyanobacterium]